ncbi:MAG: MBL fold metallo-hydrolase [Burkholderiales bacterium]|nr:MBL fold metallo-hydrolase [Burkholderiales bacterium]
MRFAALGSGSEGNALIVEAGTTRIMIDCGFGIRETVRRLARLNVTPESIDAILVTHEHGDHAHGMIAFSGKYQIPVSMTHGTRDALNGKCVDISCRTFDSHDTLEIGDLRVTAFPVPHDAREPVQFIVSDGKRRLALLTDTGTSTACIEDHITGCDAIVIECNYDSEMLRNNTQYPDFLKRRISGRYGHLRNEDASKILTTVDCSRLRHVIAAHLSQKNNHPDKVCEVLAKTLNCAPDWITVADQTNGFDWRML